jgi:hypothetical protein
MNPRTASTSLLLGAIRLAPRQPSYPYVVPFAPSQHRPSSRWTSSTAGFPRNSVNFVNFATAPASAAARHLANPADFA